MLARLRAARWMAIAALAVLLVSCTFTRFAYNQADTLASWTVDDYFGLDGSQKDEFNQRFERLWKIVNENNGDRYTAYQKETSRPIPVVVLTPA